MERPSRPRNPPWTVPKDVLTSPSDLDVKH